MRIAVYTDYPYHSVGGSIYAERAFAVFLARLAGHFDGFTVIGRLAPDPDRGRYPLGDRIDFVPLPYYKRLSQPLSLLSALAGSMRRFWKVLGDVDRVWLLGPHPFALLFAVLARVRRRQVILGVRQDLPRYVRSRHPRNPPLQVAAWLLERSFRLLGRFNPVIAVGPALARNYGHARRLLELTVSLVDESGIVAPDEKQVDYGGELRVLSVGRLDPEKNPLMLADVLARLLEGGGDWRLIVCGEGSLGRQLRERLDELGLERSAELRGYVPQEGGLRDLYRDSHMLLHVSWTEGLPQVLYEAFAAALPIVATDVGGVRDSVGGAASLVPAGDPDAAAQALRELAEDSRLRRRRIEAGHALVRGATIEQEGSRVAEFISGS